VADVAERGGGDDGESHREEDECCGLDDRHGGCFCDCDVLCPMFGIVREVMD